MAPISPSSRSRSRALIVASFIAASPLTGCATWSHATPVGGPIALSSGEPANPCETSRWLDLRPSAWVEHGVPAPTAAPASGAPRWVAVYPRARRPDGVSLTSEMALVLSDEPTLAAERSQQASDFTARTAPGSFAVLTGATLLLTAVSVAPNLFATPDGSDAQVGTLATTGALAVGGLVALIVGLAIAPRSSEAQRVIFQTQMFRDDETDVVTRGVARHNALVRAQCVEGAHAPP